MSESLPSAAQLEAVLLAALKQGDTRGVDAALTVMAVVDPHRAQALLDTMRAGINMRGRSDDEGQP